MLKSGQKVSIVIPVYNGANYLKDAIDSALGQDYENIEVIVVNDGSNDCGQTENIANSYGSRIKYYYKQNGGVSSALNCGIQHMLGDVFLWLSHDDYLSCERIKTDFVSAVEADSEVFATFCNIVYVGADRKFIRNRKIRNKTIVGPKAMMDEGCLNLCAMTIHRSCFDSVGCFDVENHTTQDVQFALLLSTKYSVHRNGSSCVYIREHPSQGTVTMSERHRLDSVSMAILIDREIGLQGFFPGIQGYDRREVAKSLEWMGDFHKIFFNYEMADEYYDLAYRRNPGVFNKYLVKKGIGARHVTKINKSKICSILKEIICGKSAR